VRSPFHETLYTHYQLLEHERIDGLIRDAEGLVAAKRATIAFHKPGDLDDERTNLLQRMGIMPTVSEALERGKKMLDDLIKIDGREAAGSGSVES